MCLFGLHIHLPTILFQLKGFEPAHEGGSSLNRTAFTFAWSLAPSSAPSINNRYLAGINPYRQEGNRYCDFHRRYRHPLLQHRSDR